MLLLLGWYLFSIKERFAYFEFFKVRVTNRHYLLKRYENASKNLVSKYIGLLYKDHFTVIGSIKCCKHGLIFKLRSLLVQTASNVVHNQSPKGNVWSAIPIALLSMNANWSEGKQGSSSKRDGSPVEHRSTFVCLSIHPV